MKEHQKCPYVVLYEDEDVLCVYKKQNVFTVKTDDKRTFTHNLYYYLKKDVLKKEEELFVLHRLDCLSNRRGCMPFFRGNSSRGG